MLHVIKIETNGLKNLLWNVLFSPLSVWPLVVLQRWSSWQVDFFRHFFVAAFLARSGLSDFRSKTRRSDARPSWRLLDCCSAKNSDEFHFRIENKFFLFVKHLNLNLQMLDYLNLNLFLLIQRSPLYSSGHSLWLLKNVARIILSTYLKVLNWKEENKVDRIVTSLRSALRASSCVSNATNA